MLEQMHLSVLRSPPGAELLITSDNPVCLWDLANPRSPHPFGLGRRTMQVTVPLTPTMSARISHVEGPDYIDIDAAMADGLSLRTLARCRETFISASPTLRVD